MISVFSSVSHCFCSISVCFSHVFCFFLQGLLQDQEKPFISWDKRPFQGKGKANFRGKSSFSGKTFCLWGLLLRADLDSGLWEFLCTQSCLPLAGSWEISTTTTTTQRAWTFSEGNSGSIHPYGRYGNAGRNQQNDIYHSSLSKPISRRGPLWWR